LELGADRGASLALWDDYLTSPDTKIIGVMHSKDVLFEDFSTRTRVTVQKGIGNTPEVAEWLGGKFDIVIDDANHHPDSQALTIKTYLPRLADGGVLIIEDVWGMDRIPALLKVVPDDFKKRTFVADLRHVLNRADDILLVIKV
jgi:hypothetical protein